MSRHTPLSNASCAHCTARPTSSADAFDSVPIAAPSAGLMMSMVSPDAASTNFPSINNCALRNCLFTASILLSPCLLERGNPRISADSKTRGRVRRLNVFQALAGRLDAKPCHHHNLNGQQADHQRKHADHAVMSEERHHDERRDDRRPSTEGVADARCTQAYFSRKQLGHVDR